MSIKSATSFIRADSKLAPSWWETSLLCNDVSHWLGASLDSALFIVVITDWLCCRVEPGLQVAYCLWEKQQPCDYDDLGHHHQIMSAGPDQWDLPVGYYFASTYRFRVASTTQVRGRWIDRHANSKDIDDTSIWPTSRGLMSNWWQAKGLCYLRMSCKVECFAVGLDISIT